MSRVTLAVVCVLNLGPPAVRADGCKFASDGRLVPEREQRAMIDWANGVETLHVAALSDPTADGTVWVVPVRAGATVVRAEPVESFPAVTYYETLRGRAEWQLREGIAVTGLLDSGGLCCPLFIGGCGGATASSAVEESRVEKLGMVVTVVTADTRASLEQYLDAQGVDRKAADLSSLGPYFGRDGFSFVCGWVARRDVPSTAAALRVEFPSPTRWFPLLPTRAYDHPITTVVYARGFVKPVPGCDLPGLTSEAVYASIESKGVGQAFESGGQRSVWEYHYSGNLEPLTRVTLAADPRRWDRDLELVPGTTAAGTLSQFILWCGPPVGFLCSGVLGAALGLLLPLFTITGGERRWVDWVAGAATGAAILLSIWASAVVFSVWRGARFWSGPWQTNRYVVLPILAIAHFAIVFAVCRLLIALCG